MASISGICSSSPSLKPRLKPLPRATSLRRDSASFPIRPHRIGPVCSVAREVSAEPSKSDDGTLEKGTATKTKKIGLEKDPRALWLRYVEWLYQHKELGLFLDVSRVGFSDEFVAEMEPRFQAAFRAMEELEKGAIANPDEGRMVGHYWLRSPHLAPTSFLKTQIDTTLDVVCDFADAVVSGKVSSSQFFPISIIGFEFITIIVIILLSLIDESFCI